MLRPWLKAMFRGIARSELSYKGARVVKFAAQPMGQTRVIAQQVAEPERAPLQVSEELVVARKEEQEQEPERFFLRQLMDGIAPETAWAERESVLDRIELASQLDRGDEFSARAIESWSEDLAHVLASQDATLLVPLFSELYAAKMLRAMYTERRSAYMAQRQSASHARSYLLDSIRALSDHVERGTPTSAVTIGGITGLTQRLELRYRAQIKQCDVEVYRASAFLKEIDGTDARGIEVAMAAHEAELKSSLSRIVEKLRHQSMQCMLRARDEADNLEAIA